GADADAQLLHLGHGLPGRVEHRLGPAARLLRTHHNRQVRGHPLLRLPPDGRGRQAALHQLRRRGMKLKITPDTTVGQALSAEPRLYGALLALGLCCVDENTVMWTMGRLADELGVDAEGLCSALNGQKP